MNDTVVASVVSVIVNVPTSTVPLNVVPPLLVSVSVPKSVPTAPLTVTAPVVLTARLEAAPPATPLTAAKLIGVAAPAPTVSVLPSAIVVLNSVIWPVEAPPTVASAVTLTAVVPRLMTPVPAALIVPAMLFEDGAVAVTPAVKARVSAASLPSVTVPVLLKVTALVMVPPPSKLTL